MKTSFMFKRNNKPSSNPHPDFKDAQQAEDFEKLYQAYYHYIYKYEVGHEEDWVPEKVRFGYLRTDFKEELSEQGLAIKVNEGY
jgi:hypothetical protein